MAQHLSLKFENNTSNEGLRLYLVGLKIAKLPSRNVTSVNYKGTHISLKFQNNTAATAFQLQTLGIGMVKLPEQ
jgi:ABC-type Fe2+-enterobactin transport system substrate-binding protein